MAIYRVNKNRDFSVINNKYIRRQDLSLKAKGLLTYLLTLPDDWKLHKIELTNHFTDGETSIDTAFKELERKKYIRRQKIYKKGKVDYIYDVFEIPYSNVDEKGISTGSEIPDQTGRDFAEQEAGFTGPENQELLNTNILNTKELSTNNTYIVENEKNKNQEAIPYQEIVEYLNEKTGKQYRYTTPKTRELIKARWKEGFRLDDFKKVIDNKTLEWKNTKWENYLRPVTLFSTKFESYLNDDPNIILRKKKEESKKEEYNIQEFFNNLEIDYIIELTGNEYNAKKRFNEYAEKYGVDKDQRTLFKEFSAWCRKLRDGERV